MNRRVLSEIGRPIGLAFISLSVAFVTQEFKEVGVETDCILIDIAALVFILALLEEDCKAGESIEALWAEV